MHLRLVLCLVKCVLEDILVLTRQRILFHATMGQSHLTGKVYALHAQWVNLVARQQWSVYNAQLATVVHLLVKIRCYVKRGSFLIWGMVYAVHVMLVHIVLRIKHVALHVMPDMNVAILLKDKYYARQDSIP